MTYHAIITEAGPDGIHYYCNACGWVGDDRSAAVAHELLETASSNATWGSHDGNA